MKHLILKYLGMCARIKEAIGFSRQTSISFRPALLIISILIISNLYLLLTLQQTSHTLNMLNTANQNLQYILALREITPAESSRMVFVDLEQISCTISELEYSPGSSNIELDDYSAFLILAQGKEVMMSQDFTFDWNPLQLRWVDSIRLTSETKYGTIEWQTSYIYTEFIEGSDNREIFDKKVARRVEIYEEHSLFDADFRLDESEANILGERFLRGLGYETVKGSFVKLETRTPNTFWNDLAGVDVPSVQGERECWVLWSSLEDSQDNPLGGFEVWIDVYTMEIIGGKSG